MNQTLSAVSPWAFLDPLNEGVILVEADGAIVYNNHAALTLLGLKEPVNSLAAVYAQIAPTITWQHLLDAPAESYLYTAVAHLHIQARPVKWEEQPLIQLLLTPTLVPETTTTSEKSASEQLAALARISQHLNATLQLENVLQAVNDEALRHTQADGCQISLFDERHERFMSQIEQGKFALSPTNKQVAAVNQARQAITFNDMALENSSSVKSALLTPILFENAVAGLIFLYSSHPNQFDEQARTFVSALANHAAIAIGNTQRFNELEKRTTLLHQRAQQIERFVESSRVFHGDRPQDEVYEDLVYAIQEGVGFGVVLLSLVDESDVQRSLRRVAAAGLPLARLTEMQKVRHPWAAVERLLQPQFRLGAAYFVPAEVAADHTQELTLSQVGDLLLAGREVVPRRLYQTALLSEGEWIDVYSEPAAAAEIVGRIPFDGHDIQAIGKPEAVGLQVWLPVRYHKVQGWVNQEYLKEEEDAARWHEQDLFIMPLLGSRGQPLGLISVDNPNDGRRPSESTAKALEIFANQAATAIENVRLLHNTRAFAGMLQQLHNISQQVLREQNFDRQLRLIVDGLGQAGWGRVSLTLRDQEFNLLQLVTSGLTADEETALHANMWSAAQWRALMNREELDRFRTGACYFLPGNDDWVAEHVSGGLLGREPRREGVADSWQPDDTLFLPLYDRQEEAIAVINLDDPLDGRHPNDHALQTIELYAQFATSIIENAQLYQETQRQLAELRTINEVSQAVSTTLDLDTLTQKIASALAKAYRVDSYYIALYNSTNDSFDYPFIVDQAEPRDASTSTPADRGPTNYIFRTGQPLLINKEADWSLVDHEAYGQLSRSYLGVPMRIADHVIGVLAIQDYEQEDAFDRQDINTLSTIAAQVAVAITNARLVSELRVLNERLDERVVERTRALGEERDRVQILLRITTELSTSLDQEHVSGRSLQMVNEFLNATQGGIILLDPENGRMSYRGGFGLDQAQRESLLNDQGAVNKLVKRALKERKASIVADLATVPGWQSEQNLIEARSLLAVPLIYGDEVIGIMLLFHAELAAFTEQQLELVEAAAAQVANAINNARLYLLIRDQAERLGTMLREEQIEAAKNEAILQSIADGVLVADVKGFVILANVPITHILDIPRNQLLGKEVGDLLGLYGAAGDNWVNTITKWGQNRQLVQPHAHLVDRFELEDKVISVQLSPVFAGNQFFGTISIFRDITKEVEVDRMKSEFVSTVSHELRTPMTSIKGYADLMLMGVAGPMSDPQTRYLQVIKNNADRLSMLVNDLLDISRIETGKTELDLRSLDVAQIIKQIVNGHLRGRIEHEDKPINVSTKLAPSLPLIYADSGRVTQILTNLLDNAFHYTPENGQIIISAEENQHYVSIHIQDTGIGIAPENLNKIFERFFRAEDADVQRIAGTGLGLSIVRSLVEMHGGTIHVASVPGVGSTFTINLPLVQEEMGRL